MTRGRGDSVIKQFPQLLTAGTAAGLSNAQLLERFRSRRDQGPRRPLPRWWAGTADVFTRLPTTPRRPRMTLKMLSRLFSWSWPGGAGRFAEPELLGAWLYGVAIARQGGQEAEIAAASSRTAGGGSARRASATDTCLPEHSPIGREEAELLQPGGRPAAGALSHSGHTLLFQGLTQTEVAHRLRCPEGTVGVRLMRARERLRDRLTRRGIAPSAVLLAAPSSRRRFRALCGALAGPPQSEARAPVRGRPRPFRPASLFGPGRKPWRERSAESHVSWAKLKTLILVVAPVLSRRWRRARTTGDGNAHLNGRSSLSARSRWPKTSLAPTSCPTRWKRRVSTWSYSDWKLIVGKQP